MCKNTLIFISSIVMRKFGLQVMFSASVLFYSIIKGNIQNNYDRVHISVFFISTAPGFIFVVQKCFNSYSPSAAYMRQWIGSALVQVMACRLFGAKPLHAPMLGYLQLDPWEQILVKLESKFYHFHSRKFIWKCHLPILRPYFPGS